jgi:uridine kinase
VAPLNFSHLLHPGQSRRPHSSVGLAASLGLDELVLPPKSPLSGARKQRQRTISTSGAINTEREPIIRASKRTIYTAGRPPWYDSQGQQLTEFCNFYGLFLAHSLCQVEPFVIGVCGGSASGKTTVANKIISELGVPWVTLLSMDSFYKVLNENQHQQAALNEVRNAN